MGSLFCQSAASVRATTRPPFNGKHKISIGLPPSSSSSTFMELINVAELVPCFRNIRAKECVNGAANSINGMTPNRMQIKKFVGDISKSFGSCTLKCRVA